MRAEQSDFDIVIAGAGPAGLALAILLAKQGLSVAIADRQTIGQLEDPAYDGREIALTYASWKILQKTGAIDKIGSHEISLIRDIKVLNGQSPYSLNFSAREIDEDHLGYMIANNVIRRGLFEAASKEKDIKFFTEVEIERAETSNSNASLSFHDGRSLKSHLIIAADGRFSKLRSFMGIDTRQHDFKKICIVCRMKHEKNLWRTAYEYFGSQRTLAILPLLNRECSVVLTLPHEQAEKMMAMTPENFADDIARDLYPYSGSLELVSERFAYPLIAVYARRFQRDRFALIGDAAVGMHPVTAHGFNLGLNGAYNLSTEIENSRSQGQSIDDASILKAYEQKHRKVTLPLYHGTNALVGLYTRTGPVSGLARQALLHLGNHFRPARNIILHHLTDRKS